MRVLPVTPWGRFVPALNAIVAQCADEGMGCVLVASAEVWIDRAAADALWSELFGGDGGEDDGAETLVVGVALRGHDYRAGGRGGGAVEVELTGRTAVEHVRAVGRAEAGAYGIPPRVGGAPSRRRQTQRWRRGG